MYTPTTREAACFPSAEEAATPSGTTVVAIFVIDIEEVFEARIASGRSSEANERKIFDLIVKFSETA